MILFFTSKFHILKSSATLIFRNALERITRIVKKHSCHRDNRPSRSDKHFLVFADPEKHFGLATITILKEFRGIWVAWSVERLTLWAQVMIVGSRDRASHGALHRVGRLLDILLLPLPPPLPMHMYALSKINKPLKIIFF